MKILTAGNYILLKSGIWKIVSTASTSQIMVAKHTTGEIRYFPIADVENVIAFTKNPETLKKKYPEYLI